MNTEDPEATLYRILDKAKKNDLYENFQTLATNSLNLYMKRFGTKEYALSIPEEEFSEQLIDCVNHLVKTTESGKELFKVFNTAEEQNFIVAMISGIMI